MNNKEKLIAEKQKAFNDSKIGSKEFEQTFMDLVKAKGIKVTSVKDLKKY